MMTNNNPKVTTQSESRTIGRACTTLLFGCLLAGCSSLQIDVDVYKGPLSHEPEIQLQQYASMAMSAKPLIERLRDMAEVEIKDCALKIDNEKKTESTSCDSDDAQRAWQFLREILALYESEKSDVKQFKTLTQIQLNQEKKGGNDPTASVALKDFLAQRWPQGRAIQAGLKELTDDFEAAMVQSTNAPGRGKAVADATARLNQALIFFAQKILFTVNQQAIFSDLNTSGKGERKAQNAVLQSLGNTILVHANDLQRQFKRKDEQEEHAASERRAVQQAMVVAPSVAFDQIEEALRGEAPMMKHTKAVTGATTEQRERLKQLGLDREAAVAKRDAYLKGIVPLVAAYRTLVEEPVASPGFGADGQADVAAAKDDRKTIEELHKTQALASQDIAGALAPLLSWLDTERSPGVVTVPARTNRLEETAKYFSAERPRLAAAGIDQAKTRFEVLKIVKVYIGKSWAAAEVESAKYAGVVDVLTEERDTLRTTIAGLDTRAKKQAEIDDANQKAKTDNSKVLAVLASLRNEVLAQADLVKTTDTAGLLSLLKLKVGAWTQSKGGTPSEADVNLTRVALKKLNQVSNPVSLCATQSVGNAVPKESDRGELASQIDVIDCKIGMLRAQRVVALANGNQLGAENLLRAINAAYDQRTSMVYLRPASAYLSSVYSASDLQESAEPEHRNMLLDWARFLRPNWKWINPVGDTRRAKQQLEKLYWQNINTVKLSGGGATNYVLAKDDVGNWYVKAYGSDPEAIIKSATSLALFNTGKSFNTNLLRRLDLQRQIDDPKITGDRATQLRAELERNNSQDGVPVLRMRDHYAERYQKETEAQARAMLDLLTDLPDALSKRVKGIAVKSDENPPAACSTPDATAGLGRADHDNLAPSRGKLEGLLKNASTARVADVEHEIQRGMNAVNLYTGQIYRLLVKLEVESCARAWRLDAAEQARSTARARLLVFATGRLQSIERFEDALTTIAAMASGI